MQGLLAGSRLADIHAVAGTLDDLEVELWKLQRAVEKRPQTIHPPAAQVGPTRALWRWLKARMRRQ